MDRWRPDDHSGPVCGYTLRGVTCTQSGAHHCQPRADRPVFFFREFLLHIKGTRARTPFVLDLNGLEHMKIIGFIWDLLNILV